MLSFENVLDCFALVIQTGICEVLLTRHGYVVMEWDEEEREWFNVTHCDTPEALREAILSAYEGYLQLALVTDCHNPTEEEIRDGIAGNLCRCTGYAKIVEAIDCAAKKLAKAKEAEA